MTSRPWAAPLTARLSRARDPETVDIVEYGHGELTRRISGPGGPLVHRVEPLDQHVCRELLDELRAGLGTLPADIDHDVAGFVHLLEGSLVTVPAT